MAFHRSTLLKFFAKSLITMEKGFDVAKICILCRAA